MRVSFHRADRSPLPDQSVYVLQNTIHQLSQTRFRSYYHTTRYVCCMSMVILPIPHGPKIAISLLSHSISSWK